MTKTEYAEFLKSDYWQQLRRNTLEAERSCKRCKIPRWLAIIAYDQDLHVHHKTYERLGRELPIDLEVLCRRCHEIETFKRSDLKAPKTFACVMCKQPSYDIFPWDEPLCSICHAIEYGELEEKYQLPHYFDGEPIWQQILTQLANIIGIDEIIDKLADMDQEQRAQAEEYRKFRLEHPEMPF